MKSIITNHNNHILQNMKQIQKQIREKKLKKNLEHRN